MSLDNKEQYKDIEDSFYSDFSNLYLSFFSKLLIESEKYVKDIMVAEEIVQGVFLKIWEAKLPIKQINSISSYLYRSVINSSINHLKREKNITEHHLLIVDNLTNEDLEQIDEENLLIAKLYQAIENLPPKCREVFKLSRFEGLKYKEIAKRLNISERTVENHVATGLKQLRELMLSEQLNSKDTKKLLSILFNLF